MNVASYLWENFFPPASFMRVSRIHKNVDRYVYVERKKESTEHISNNMKNTQKTHFRKNIQEFHPQQQPLALQLAVLCKNLVYIFSVSSAIKERNFYTNKQYRQSERAFHGMGKDSVHKCVRRRRRC
jgi:hypothetical protein